MDRTNMDRLGLAAAVGVGLRTGLLMELTRGPTTRAALGTKLGLDARALGLVLDVLACEGLVRHDGSADGDGVAAGPELEALAGTPGGFALTLGLWAHLDTFVKTGAPFVQMDLGPSEREAAYSKVVSGLGELFDAMARDLAERLPLRPKNVLDVGCGSGVWSLAIGARHPEARVTGLDLPAVLENFQARAKTRGLAGRTATIPGNMHEVAVPAKTFDLIVIANVLRLEPPESAASVVKRLAPALTDDGALLVIDALAHGTPERERSRAVYAMHLGLRTRNGQVHAPGTITRWLNDAGLAHVESIDVADGAGGVGALLAKKSK